MENHAREVFYLIIIMAIMKSFNDDLHMFFHSPISQSANSIISFFSADSAPRRCCLRFLCALARSRLVVIDLLDYFLRA